jgi:hypothetical protein
VGGLTGAFLEAVFHDKAILDADAIARHDRLRDRLTGSFTTALVANGRLNQHRNRGQCDCKQADCHHTPGRHSPPPASHYEVHTGASHTASNIEYNVNRLHAAPGSQELQGLNAQCQEYCEKRSGSGSPRDVHSPTRCEKLSQ